MTLGRTHRPVRAARLLGALVALGSLATLVPSRAARAADSLDHLDGTPDELAGWRAAEEDKWVRARELGEKILRERPDSYAGHYVLGVAMHYGEGDLARSAYHLTEAATRFERRFGKVPGDVGPWRWHEAILRELAFSLNELDRPAEELAVLDRYDTAYKPKRVAQRVWPLMKLHRYDAARAAARAALASGRREQEMIARSDLCAAECEAGDRELAYGACTAALAPFHEQTYGGQVEFSNASEAALSVYRFDEAERFLGESTKRAMPTSWGNPYQHLAVLYLAEGRITEAIAAVKQGHELRLSRPAYLDQHGQARLDWTVAALLLVAGETERASQIAERADARPDRQGVHSGTEDQASAASAVLLAVALRELSARHREEAVTAGVWAAARLRWRAAAERIAAWHEERRAAVIFADEDFLVRTIRPYYVGGADMSEWMVPETARMVGPGVLLAALQRARAADRFGAAPAYYDALEAEAELLRGHDGAALAAADRSLAGLPHAEGLLSGRVAAIAGLAAERTGEHARATAYFSTALARDPDVLRRLDVALPVRVETDGSPLARAAADLLGASPRFDLRSDAGHIVALRADSSGGEACLYGAGHAVLQCNAIGIAPGTPTRDGARQLIAALHKVAFAFKTGLGQSDLTSLDGSPTAARADRQVKSLLDGLGGGGDDGVRRVERAGGP